VNSKDTGDTFSSMNKIKTFQEPIKTKRQSLNLKDQKQNAVQVFNRKKEYLKPNGSNKSK